MTRKQKAPPPVKVREPIASKTNRTVLPFQSTEDENERNYIAKIYLLPQANAARLVLAYNPDSSLDLHNVAANLSGHTNDVKNGDLSQAEAMLVNQAHALQAMFVNFAERAKLQSGLPQVQTLTSLALKAQSQCRATLQTLVEVKYPRQATFIKQANIAGQQQVNNGAPVTSDDSRAREEKAIQSNGLLEEKYGERLDDGTTQATIGVNKKLEAVGKIDRPKNARRQKPC